MFVYIASGWFNPQQVEDLEIIKSVVESCGIQMFSPRDECECPPDGTMVQRFKVFTDNLNAIERCSLVVCNTRDKDIGTIFESGYAYKCKKPIIFFCRGLKGAFNLMLAQSGIAVVTDKEDLQKVLLQFKSNNKFKRLYKGRIQ